MKSKKWIVSLGIALLVITSIIGSYVLLAEGEKETAKASGPSTVSSPLIDDQGDVQVVAIWERSDNSLQQKFQIQLNNHQVDLSDFDLKNNIFFQKNGRDIASSIVTESKKPEGHHLATEFVVESQEFMSLKKGQELTLVVKNVLNTPERVFTWTY